MSQIWAEWSFSADGMGVTLYREDGDAVIVEDEAWLTNTEILEGNNENIILEPDLPPV
jgi:hypothetical protein